MGLFTYLKLNGIRCTTGALVASLVFAPTLCFAEPDYTTYQVRGGENLSSILYNDFELKPIYGRRGYLALVTKLNPGKVAENGDLIRPGDVIIIPIVKPIAEQVVKPAAKSVASRTVTPVIKPIVRQTEASIAKLTTAAVSKTDRPSKRQVAGKLKSKTSRKQARSHSHRARMPASAPGDATPNEAPSSFSKVRFSVGGDYIGLFGTQITNQTTAQFLSGLSPTYQLAWVQVWDENRSTHLFVNSQNVSFDLDRVYGLLSSGTFTNTGFGFGYSQRFADWITIGADAELAQTLFYKALDATTLQINQVPIFRFHPEATFTLIKRRPFEVSVIAGVSIFGPSSYGNYSIDTGFGYNGAAQITQEFKRADASCKLGYAERRQNTSYLTLVQKDVGIMCGLAWKLY